MGFEIFLAPCVGLGFCMHLERPSLELVLGPFIIRLGDSLEDDDEE